MSTPKFNQQTPVYVTLTEKGVRHITEETKHTCGPESYHVHDNVYKMTVKQVFFFFSRRIETFSAFVEEGDMFFEDPSPPATDSATDA